MKRAKNHSGVWQYLEAQGVLEHGSPDEIAAARSAYWKAYRRQYNQTKRKAFTVSLTVPEAKRIVRAAEQHRLPPCTFLKRSALAYLGQSYVVPDAEFVAEIRILFARTCQLLQRMQEESGYEKMQDALQLLEKLEDVVLRALTAPARSSSAQQSYTP